MNNIIRKKIRAGKTGDSSGTEIFQNIDNEKIYYKDLNGNVKELINTDSLNSVVSALENETQYVEVTLSSIEILALADRPKELLPALPPNKYYSIQNIDFEVIQVKTHYDVSAVKFLQMSMNEAVCFLDPNLLADNTYVISAGPTLWTYYDGSNILQAPFFTGESSRILLQAYGGNPSKGDNTLLVKIRYKIKTVGSEL